MNRGELVDRARSYTRDLSSSVFREIDVTDYIDEAIDRCKTRIPELSGMTYLASNSDSPTYLPSEYHYLLAVFSASRCFFQDERDYKASTMMNEFEVKLDELLLNVINGDVVISDSEGVAVESTFVADYVVNVYFDDDNYEGTDDGEDDDEGVEGLE